MLHKEIYDNGFWLATHVSRHTHLRCADHQYFLEISKLTTRLIPSKHDCKEHYNTSTNEGKFGESLVLWQKVISGAEGIT